MGKLSVLGALVVLSGVAGAQGYPQQQTYPPAGPPPPSQYPQQYPQPQPQQQPQQYPQPYPQYGYQQPQPMQIQLTVDEQWLLQRGYISPAETIGGGLGALFIGFGAGQAIEGRWSQKGYIFTIGEVASIGAVIWGFVDLVGSWSCDSEFDTNCHSDHETRGEVLLWGGMIGISVFRVWEIIDAFGGPGEHNRELNALRARMGLPPLVAHHRVLPYVAPGRDRDGGGVAGVALRF